MPEFKVGDQVIYWRYNYRLGTVVRVGETFGIKDSAGWVDKRVESRYVYPATKENLERLEQIKAIGREIDSYRIPLEHEQDLLKEQIRKSRE